LYTTPVIVAATRRSLAPSLRDYFFLAELP